MRKERTSDLRQRDLKDFIDMIRIHAREDNPTYDYIYKRKPWSEIQRFIRYRKKIIASKNKTQKPIDISVLFVSDSDSDSEPSLSTDDDTNDPDY